MLSELRSIRRSAAPTDHLLTFVASELASTQNTKDYNGGEWPGATVSALRWGGPFHEGRQPATRAANVSETPAMGRPLLRLGSTGRTHDVTLTESSVITSGRRIHGLTHVLRKRSQSAGTEGGGVRYLAPRRKARLSSAFHVARRGMDADERTERAELILLRFTAWCLALFCHVVFRVEFPMQYKPTTEGIILVILELCLGQV